MKLFVALGAGDIVAAHRAQLSGQKSETQIIFSGQLFEYCRDRGIRTMALSYNRRSDYLHDGPLQLENRPRVLEHSSGIIYHISRIVYGLYLAVRARRFGADLAIIDSGSAHYFALTFFRLLGIPVAVNFHNVLWPNGFEPKRWVARLIRSFDSWFFRRIAAATTGVSPECGRQVRQLAGYPVPFFECRSQYHGNDFQISRNSQNRSPFCVTYVGRVERNKGVLDIVGIAEQVRDCSRVPILFEVCGDGSSLTELRQTVAEKSLTGMVLVHGRLPRSELFRLYMRAHAVIVPTRSDFCEGLPAVCAEAVLSGLPIITSRLSNAIPVLGPAIMEAEPENIESYVQAILKLAEDHATYDRLRDACPKLALQFLDRSQSYPAAVDRLIAHLFPSWKTLDSYEPLFERLT